MEKTLGNEFAGNPARYYAVAQTIRQTPTPFTH
jgi:hypothetical protein